MNKNSHYLYQNELFFGFWIQFQILRIVHYIEGMIIIIFVYSAGNNNNRSVYHLINAWMICLILRFRWKYYAESNFLKFLRNKIHTIDCETKPYPLTYLKCQFKCSFISFYSKLIWVVTKRIKPHLILFATK